MTDLAARIVRFWVKLYTAGLEASARDRIRQEVEADLWEQMNSRDAASHPIREASLIMLRWMLGIPADVQRILEESNSQDSYKRTKKFFGVVVQRRSWLNLLIISGVSFSLLFIGICTFIGAIFIITLPVVLLASPFIALWPSARFSPISLTHVLETGLLFLIGLVILIVELFLSKWVYTYLGFKSHNSEQKRHSGFLYKVFGLLGDSKAWSSLSLSLLVMLSLMFPGIITFTAAIVLAVIIGAFIGNPFIYSHYTYRIIGPLVINNPVESALGVIFGLGLALLTMHLCNLITRNLGKVAIARFRPTVSTDK